MHMKKKLVLNEKGVETLYSRNIRNQLKWLKYTWNKIQTTQQDCPDV